VLFNSIEYALFLPAVVTAYYLLGQAHRWKLLLAASYAFYAAWKPGYLLLIVASTLVDYWAGLRMDAASKKQKKVFLWASLAVNLGLLFTFKYFNFFAETFNALLGYSGTAQALPALEVLLPVGISFYTFQTLSYTIDIYRGERRAESHLGLFALYVAFFPQLVAGPIERSTRLLPQLHKEHRFSYTRSLAGLELILWGLFKKVVIADRLAVLVDAVYGNPGAHTGPMLICATVFFAFQIYCDFSGYSDIAIGSARLLGIDLMVNFRAPYFAASIGEFWQRWHISLSTWFRDYVYIPLGGSRTSKGRHLGNLLITFVVSGLWHGANWTFIVWGLLHGCWLVAEVLLGINDKRPTQFWPRLGRQLWVFFLANVAWVFFRAANIGDAILILRRWPQGWGQPLRESFASLEQFSGGDFLLSFLLIGTLLFVDSRTDGWRLGSWLAKKPRQARWAFYYAAAGALLLFATGGAQQFIYFQF
jgi:alginate O-acetyltransferase complex protein AlgI